MIDVQLKPPYQVRVDMSVAFATMQGAAVQKVGRSVVVAARAGFAIVAVMGAPFNCFA